MEDHESSLPYEVAATYGLDVRTASRLEGGYSNESWRVEGAAGSFVVRRYGRLHVTRRALLFEHGVMLHASRRLPEVHPPLCGPDGSTLCAHGGRLVAVLPYVAGDAGRRDAEAAMQAGRIVARFHRAIRDVHVSGGTRSTRSVGLLGKLRERFVGFAADRNLALKLDWNALIAATTGAAARLAALSPGLPKAIVHGDVNPGNVVHPPRGMGSPGAAGLIDFDFTHEGERGYDVATGLDEFGRSGDDAPLDLDAAGRFATGYGEELALVPAERAAIPDLMIRRNATLIWYIVTRHGERVPGDIGNAPRYLARIREIEKLRERLPGLLT